MALGYGASLSISGGLSGSGDLSNAGGLTPSAGSRVAAANNNNIPVQQNTSGTWVHNCWTTHVSGPAGYTNVEVTFLNGLISTNSEQDTGYDFVIRCGILLNGVFYQGKCNGQTEVTVSRSWGTATFIFPTLPYLPPNTTFYVTNRRVAADNGAAGSYNVITNTGGITQRQDGLIAGTNPAVDLTLGVGVGFGAANFRVSADAVTVSGRVSRVVRSSAGQNYTSPLNLAPWYGAAGVNQPGSLIPGTGITGYGVVSAGAGTYISTTLTSGGTLHDPGNPPFVFVGGAATPATGFGTPTAAYGPTLITGVPRVPTPSVLLHGDSITMAYQSVDSTGDLKGNYGLYEQRLANQYGVFKMAVNGESASGWLTTNTRQKAFISAMIARGLRITHVILALGTNDFLNNGNSNVVTVTRTNIETIRNYWRSLGAKVILVTLPPATVGNFTSAGGQLPVSAGGNTLNYEAGGRVQQYNALITTNVITGDGIIDLADLVRDAVASAVWRSDAYSAGTPFPASDGIHPSQGVGIPYCVLNLTIPALTV